MAPAQSTQSTSALTQPVMSLWGVGADRAKLLEKLRIRTVEDLLLHKPRRHEDRRHTNAIADLQQGQAATVRGLIVAAGLKTYRKGAKSVFEIIVDDGTARLHCRWWNLPFMQNYFEVGDDVFVFGKPVSMKPRAIDHPETEVIEQGEETSIHINRIVPIYPLTEGLPQRWLRALIWRTLERHADDFTEPHPELKLAGHRLKPALPGLPSRAEAVRMLHFPEEPRDVEIARERLALDEFIELQWSVQTRRRNLQTKARALPCAGDNRLMRPFLNQLGFRLTDAQTKVLREIRGDMGGAQPMRRLLQGDVGSGKTVVAACVALMALESGFTVALMAPTEILAEQHFATFEQWFAPLGVRVEIRTGSRKGSNVERSTSKTQSARREVPPASDKHLPILLIGTHALLTQGFDVPRLGLVIIDEQHKFGVAQREQLVRKGAHPHLLVMTATPIPRTLGLTLYGDLDNSLIDHSPSGRGPVKTFVRPASRLPKVWDFVREKLREGRQAYVVYPRVEEADPRTGAKAVIAEHEKLQATLAPYQVGLVHGRLNAAGKDQVMSAFRSNEIQILLATSVVEVGVDVSNATVMVIENADQFGLAQLHQLRGRIGRGAQDSFCILIAEAKTDEARQRLRVLEETRDGFKIAEADLALRGPGDLLGQQQSGLPPLRFGDLARDRALLEEARELVARALAREPATGLLK